MKKHFHRKKSCEKRCKIGTCTNILLFCTPWLANGMFLADYNPIFAPLAHVKVKDIINRFDKVVAFYLEGYTMSGRLHKALEERVAHLEL